MLTYSNIHIAIGFNDAWNEILFIHTSPCHKTGLIFALPVKRIPCRTCHSISHSKQWFCIVCNIWQPNSCRKTYKNQKLKLYIFFSFFIFTRTVVWKWYTTSGFLLANNINSVWGISSWHQEICFHCWSLYESSFKYMFQIVIVTI